MKKNIFFYAVALCVAMSSVSCSSDDEEFVIPDTPVTLQEPENASQAAAFVIADNALQANSGDASLTAVNITESGKAIIEVNTSEGVKYVTYAVTLENGVYVVTDSEGKKVGEVSASAQAPSAPAQSAPRRAAGDTYLTINITVTIPGVGTFTFTTDSPVAATKVVETIAATSNTTNIARTWKVVSMNIVLEGDVDLSKIERSGNLKVFADAAQEAGAGLTAEEMRELNRTILGVTLDKNGLFSLEYEENGVQTSEACNWSWMDSAQQKVLLKLRKESEFGNKFLSDDSVITVDFNPTGCAFTLSTQIKGSKTYTATLTLVLK